MAHLVVLVGFHFLFSLCAPSHTRTAAAVGFLFVRWFLVTKAKKQKNPNNIQTGAMSAAVTFHLSAYAVHVSCFFVFISIRYNFSWCPTSGRNHSKRFCCCFYFSVSISSCSQTFSRLSTIFQFPLFFRSSCPLNLHSKNVFINSCLVFSLVTLFWFFRHSYFLIACQFIFFNFFSRKCDDIQLKQWFD